MPENMNNKWRSQHSMQVIAWHFCHAQAFCRLLLPVLVTTVKLWVTVLGWFFFYYQLEVWICFWSLVAQPPTSCTWAFSLCILVLYGELISSFSGFKTSRRPPEIHLLLNCLSLATLHPLASGAFCLSILTAACFSRVGQPVQNILKPLIVFAKLN